MKTLSKAQILRYLILTAFLIIVLVAAYRHQSLGGGPSGAASIHAICPFGGIETLYQYIAGGEYLKRTNVSNFILLGGTTLLALLLGRVFCGWICMFGWIQEIPAKMGRWIFRRRFIVPPGIDRPLRYLKYVALLASIYFTWKLADLVISPYDPFAALAHLPAGIASVAEENLIGLIVLIATFVLSFFYDRVFCKYLCPMGAFLGIIYKLTNYKIKRNEETCIHCNKCTKACPVNIDVAKTESVTSAECINCLECVTACPKQKETLRPLALRKYMKPVLVGIAGVIIYVGIIEGADLAGVWKSKESNLAEVVEKGGILDPYSIRGFMTMEEIAKTFNVDINVLYKELGITLDKVPPTTQMKKVKEIDTRLGENSVRDAVARVTGYVKTESPSETVGSKAVAVQDTQKPETTAPVQKEQTHTVEAATPASKTPAAAGVTAPTAAQPVSKTSGYSEEKVTAMFEGKGAGEKTLTQISKENDIDMDYIRKRLAAKNFTAKEDETVKDIAGRYNTTPIQFLKTLLVDTPAK
ncbi:MAG TPA: 4Fe-4S binding protein [Syntrophorhabdaceae bacterium]|nr:4Fe-4S binding protein [Syntrophorhabdaceae bacterium]